MKSEEVKKRLLKMMKAERIFELHAEKDDDEVLSTWLAGIIEGLDRAYKIVENVFDE